LFDSYQVIYFEQSTYAILKHLLQLGKTVIIKALANGRVFKTKNQPLSKALSDCRRYG
jgi:hypothetical protein